MLRGLFERKPKHERLQEEPEVRFRGLLVTESVLGYRYIPPGGKNLDIAIDVLLIYMTYQTYQWITYQKFRPISVLNLSADIRAGNDRLG